MLTNVKDTWLSQGQNDGAEDAGNQWLEVQPQSQVILIYVKMEEVLSQPRSQVLKENKRTNKKQTKKQTNKQTKNGRAQHGFVEQTEVCLDVTTPEIQ